MKVTVGYVIIIFLCVFVKKINASFRSTLSNVNVELGPRPHIIFILADDLGWNDVGFHGSNEIPTPNIDALAYSGVILNNYYVQPMCSPSRSALMTGKHPTLTGMHHDALMNLQPDALPIKEKILPQYLKDLGYATHIVGKWHLGFFHRNYTPTHRGFDSHFGYWPAYMDYFNHSTQAYIFNTMVQGRSLRDNMKLFTSHEGVYATDLFTSKAVGIINNHNTSKPLFLYLAHLAPHTGSLTDPLEAPLEVINNFSYIPDLKRRIYAAMVSKLDDSIGTIMQALAANGMLENSIVVLSTDNGGISGGPPVEDSAGNNFPFRGIKTTHWQGGIRGVGAIWSPLLQKKQRISNDLMHIKDWLPTLCEAIGGGCDTVGRGLDSESMWSSLSYGTPPKRKEILINCDDRNPKGAIIRNNYKLIYGEQRDDNAGEYNDWYGTDAQYGGIPEYGVDDIINSNTYRAILQTIGHDGDLQESKFNALRSSLRVNCGSDLKVECVPSVAPCLFKLDEDPCELRNIAAENPNIVNTLLSRIAFYNQSVVPYRNILNDIRADPERYNDTWVTWCDLPDMHCTAV